MVVGVVWVVERLVAFVFVELFAIWKKLFRHFDSRPLPYLVEGIVFGLLFRHLQKVIDFVPKVHKISEEFIIIIK